MPKVVLVILSVLVVLVLFIVILSLVAQVQFNQSVNKEVESFYSQVENNHKVIQSADLTGLPTSVQTWLKNSQVIGKERIISARTKQDVILRLKEDQAWMNAQVKQYFRTDEPGFIWTVDIKMAPFLHIAGKDKYIDGRGNMLIKVLSMIPVANASGPEIDQGTLLRYLAETMWFPTAALSDYIQWEEVDAHSAKATMSYKGVTASGVFTFNENGEIESFEAERYGDFDGEYRLETWRVAVSGYKEFKGIKVPSEGELIWKLKTGDFHWYQFNVKELEYNQPSSY